MGAKKINQLTAVSDATAYDNTQLLPLSDPITGIAGKMTVQQAKKSFSTFKKKYVAAGGEASLTITELAGMEVISIAREGATMYEVTSAPDPVEFTFNGTAIGLGLALNPGERLLIQYKNPA